MIIVTDPARPLPRAAKGTVVTPQALSLYGSEIERLYATLLGLAGSQRADLVRSQVRSGRRQCRRQGRGTTPVMERAGYRDLAEQTICIDQL